MSHEEILRVCRSLARKYNDPQEYDDLVSEGVMCMLDLVKQGEKRKGVLYKSAAVVMNEYYNIKRNSVYVPVQGKAKGMTAESAADTWTALALQNALYGESIQFEDYMTEAPSTEGLFEQKEFLEHMLNVAVKVLSETELKIIHMRYWQDMPQDEVGDALGQNKMWVSRKEAKALETICNNL